MSMLRIHALLLLLAWCLCAGCDRENGAAPGAAGANAGRAREVRIVSLSPAVSVMLRDLGYADGVVGRHAYELALNRSIPACGDQAGIDYEQLLRVRPTHVILEWGSRQVPARLTELAQQHGWRIKNVSLLTLRDIADAALDVDTMLQPDEKAGSKAEALAQRLRELATPPPQPAPTSIGPVLLLAAASPPAALGPGSCHHELLLGLGQTPALAQGAPFMELSSEELVRLSPGAIILLEPRAPEGGADAPPAPPAVDRSQWRSRLRQLRVPAALEGRVAIIDHPLGQLPSTSLLEIADLMRAQFREWEDAQRDK